jgi:CheY-like chemotaxis protein
LTSNAYPSDRVNAINAGCNDFLAKPLQVPELLYKLKLHLGLTWIYQEDDKGIPDKMTRQKPYHLPPDVLEDINAYIRIGDLMGLNQYLTELSQHNPEHWDFTQRILKLSSEFRLVDIKKLLNLTAEKINRHD